VVHYDHYKSWLKLSAFLSLFCVIKWEKPMQTNLN